MCRILYLKSQFPVVVQDHLERFAEIARTSREYQGDGWGIALRREDKWQIHKSVDPVWQDDLSRFGRSDYFLIHARSAFKDSPVIIENNMPFNNNGLVFIFNGELQGVRLDMPGSTGAEKIFNFLQRLYRQDLLSALTRTMDILQKRSQYIRAANLIVAGENSACLASLFNQEPEYFTLHRKKTESTDIICSMPYHGETGWRPVANQTIESIL